MNIFLLGIDIAKNVFQLVLLQFPVNYRLCYNQLQPKIVRPMGEIRIMPITFL